MECPKCGTQLSQGDAVECPACGVILSKASKFVPPPADVYRPIPATAATPAQSASGNRGLLIPALAILFLFFAWRMFTRRSGAPAIAEAGWYHGAGGYDRAIDEQRSSKQPVLLYFHTEWCGYCRRLESEVFGTRRFDDAYGSFLKVKVNPETGSAEQSLAERFSVRAYPTVYVIAGGSPRAPIVGYAPPDQYYEALKHSIGD